jgi:aspartate kinase
MGALIVQKYGGTSVDSPERIQAVARKIAKTYAQGNQLVIVVSAMGQTTDELIKLGYQVSERPPHREMDMLLTAGERISMALLSMALSDLQVNALSLTGSQTGIITDDNHRNARIKKILGDRVRATLLNRKVAIVAGFQGVSENKEITTLGRGGSDTTAVALAAALSADTCEIYTDVDGIYSADPRLISQPRLWKQIPNDLMLEMATRGAQVLHPRSIVLAKQFKVKIRVRNSLNEKEGTEVILQEKVEGMEEFQIVGVTSCQTQGLLHVRFTQPGLLASLWNPLDPQHFSIIAPVFSEDRAIFFIDLDSQGAWNKHLEQLVREGAVREFKLDDEQIPVSIVGNRFAQDGAALSSVVETLTKSKIPIFHAVGSALAITVAVPKAQANEAVLVLHKKFINEEVT